jgi:Protein of unknown function (DUF2946)
MQWFRAKLKAGALLALFALTVQIALSFGHVHLGNFGHAIPSLASASTQSTPSAPPQQPAGHADDYCAICATIHLTATSFLPPAPQAPVPCVARSVEHFNTAAVVFIAPRRAPFRSRAPPLA